jgi:hypothetical protein
VLARADQFRLPAFKKRSKRGISLAVASGTYHRGEPTR